MVAATRSLAISAPRRTAASFIARSDLTVSQQPTSSRSSSSLVRPTARPSNLRCTARPFKFTQCGNQYRFIALESPMQTIQDSEHPNGLWYHPIANGAGKVTYAVSYLSRPPSSASSPSIMALVTTQSGEDPAEAARSNPNNVAAQRSFWELLHKTLKEDIIRKEKDAILVQEADLRENGWAHLADERQPLMPGRIPTPDAIIASVSFTDCKIAPDSYTPNDTYRPITKEEGFTVLRKVWLDALKAALKAK